MSWFKKEQVYEVNTTAPLTEEDLKNPYINAVEEVEDVQKVYISLKPVENPEESTDVSTGESTNISS